MAEPVRGALLLGGTAPAQTVGSDSWAATDALGRKVRDYKEAGAKKPDKFVAMFYWTWHQGNDDTTYRVKNITEIVRQHPEAMKDYHHPAWGTKQPGFFFWEQPLLGYYKTTDPWVLRKHAEMLADAGVDAVFFDCTNGSLTWQDSYEALLKTWDQAQKDGVNVPKIAFMLPFGPAPHSLVSLRQLYNDLYKPGRYENLWFVWKGKPCIMAYPDNLTDSPTDRAIADFFTFRPGQPDYVDGPTRNDQWGWLEVYPQHGYVKSPDGDFEQVAVGIAQNTSPDRKGHCGAFNVKDAYGRNFSVRNGFDPRVDGYLYGWNFDEQWERAYELDPELVFVTAGTSSSPDNGCPRIAGTAIRSRSSISTTGTAAATSSPMPAGVTEATYTICNSSTKSGNSKAWTHRKSPRLRKRSVSAAPTAGTTWRPITVITGATRCTATTGADTANIT
ncbi:MAG: hypothetical protein ACLTTP_04955 [Alistipes ihumii]